MRFFDAEIFTVTFEYILEISGGGALGECSEVLPNYFILELSKGVCYNTEFEIIQ